MTSYAYSTMDRVTTRTDPLLHPETYTYDNNGNPTQGTDRKSQVTSRTYDALDRLSAVTYQDGSTTTYTWDAGNRPTQLVDSLSGNITRTYDLLDRLTEEGTPEGTVSYTYDTAGRRASMTALGQPQVAYTYDNADRLTQITQGTSTVGFTYDNANRRTSLTLPNGVVTEYSYDAASRLTGLTYKNGPTVLGTLTYAYDAAGNRTTLGGTWAATGIPQPVSSATYNAGNQQLTFGGQTLSYDANGNLTSDGVNTYTWDTRNRLVALDGTSTTATFSYDALGRRQSTIVNGTTTQFLFDGLNPVQEIGVGTTATLLTGLGIDEYLTRTDQAGTRSLLTDALGSTVALTDATGTVQTLYTYEPFGTATATGSDANPFQFTGRENDGTELYYYRARYYHPWLQRFVSEDPIGFLAGDSNAYAYAGNRPASYRDSLGLCADPGGIGPRYCIDSFIEDKRVRGLGAGDDRGTDPASGTYRTHQLLFPGGGSDAWAGYTYVLGVPLQGTARCNMTRLSGRKIRASCTAWNGYAWLTQDSPLIYEFVIRERPDGSAEMVSAYGTSFPSFEIYQYGGPTGQPELVYFYSHRQHGTTYYDLSKGPGPLPLR